VAFVAVAANTNTLNNIYLINAAPASTLASTVQWRINGVGRMGKVQESPTTPSAQVHQLFAGETLRDIVTLTFDLLTLTSSHT